MEPVCLAFLWKYFSATKLQTLLCVFVYKYDSWSDTESSNSYFMFMRWEYTNSIVWISMSCCRWTSPVKKRRQNARRQCQCLAGSVRHKLQLLQYHLLLSMNMKRRKLETWNLQSSRSFQNFASVGLGLDQLFEDETWARQHLTNLSLAPGFWIGDPTARMVWQVRLFIDAISKIMLPWKIEKNQFEYLSDK